MNPHRTNDISIPWDAHRSMGRPIRSFIVAAISLVLALSLATPCFADVRKNDVVMGETMSSRGLKATFCPSVESNYVYLIDEDGTVYFERSATEPVQIASVTKIMTAIIAREYGSTDMDIVVSSNAATVGESSAGLRTGDVLSFDDALKGLMIPSGNDAAIALGECVGKIIYEKAQSSGESLKDANGSDIQGNDDAAYLAAFVSKMNDKANELGCTDTLFENPHGLDNHRFEGNLHSTAEDVSKIAMYAMQDEYFRSIVDLPEATLKVKRNGTDVDVIVKSTDELLGQYEGACGIKTGNTPLAGPCFAGACERNGRMLYAILLDSTSEQQRFTDATTLYDWVYDNYIMYDLAHSDITTSMTTNGTTKDVPVVAEVALKAWVDKTVPATFADPDAVVEVFAPLGNISQSFEFNDILGGVRAGDVIGRATFYQRNEIIKEIDIVACEDVAAPSIFESFRIWWDKLMRMISGRPDSAQSVIINECELIVDKN